MTEPRLFWGRWKCEGLTSDWIRRWRRSEHINCLELRAALHCIQWRARRSRHHSFRTMLLIDNQSIIAVIAKGRSSSPAIGRLLRRLQLCAALWISISWWLGLIQPTTQLTRFQDALMVIGKITKQQRREERLVLGKLGDLVVKPGHYRNTISILTDSLSGPYKTNSVSQILCRLTLPPLSTLKRFGVMVLVERRLLTFLLPFNLWCHPWGTACRWLGDSWRLGQNMSCQLVLSRLIQLRF